MRSFRGQLLALVLAVTLPLVVLAAALGIGLAQSERSATLQKVQDQARALQAALEREFTLTIASLEALATSPTVDDAIAGGPASAGAAAFHAQASALIATRPTTFALMWLLPVDAATPIVNTAVPPGHSPPPLTGARFPARPTGERPAPGAALREAVATGQPYIGDLVEGPVAGWLIPVVVPVRRDGTMIGVVAAGLRPAKLGQMMRDQLGDSPGTAAILDRGAIIVSRTDDEERFVGGPASPDGVAFQTNLGITSRHGPATTVEGTHFYSSFERLTSAPFAVAYGAPRNLVDEPFRRTILLSGAAALLTLAAVSAAVFWLGQRLGAEMTALSADAALLARGEAPPPHAGPRVREIAAVQTALIGATRALAESEAQLRLFTERAPAAIAMFDRQMRYLGASRRYIADYGLDGRMEPNDLVGKSHYEVFPDIAEQWRDIHRQVMAGKTMMADDDAFLRADGRTDWIRWEMAPWHRQDGTVGGALLFSEVITYRKQADEALRESEGRLRSILRTVPDAMIIIDECGIIESFSTAAEQLFGWPADEVLGRNVSMLMPSPDRENHHGYLARYTATGERRIIGTGRVVSAQRRDGTTFPAELSLGEVHVVGRRLFTGFLRDLSQRFADERRLQEAQAQLLHMSRLSVAGEMASALAHELNQPLGAIVNYTKGALRLLRSRARPAECDDPELMDAIDRVAAQSLRAGQIVRHLREFVSNEDADKRHEDLPPLIREAATLALGRAREQGIQISFRLAEGLPRVLVDRVQIQQVLLNLIRNAVEAMAEGEMAGSAAPPSLIVTAGQSPPDMIEIAVADNGPGLAPEIAERIFDSFVSSKRTGMGLGLSICRRIVEAHGGRLWAEPNPVGGTVFRFTLPI